MNMEYKQIISKLSYLKSEGEIADYNIDSILVVKDGHMFVNSKLVIFNADGKPSVMSGITQGDIDTDVEVLHERAVELAYEQNPIRDGRELRTIV
jgi:hypothetical protein